MQIIVKKTTDLWVYKKKDILKIQFLSKKKFFKKNLFIIYSKKFN